MKKIKITMVNGISHHVTIETKKVKLPVIIREIMKQPVIRVGTSLFIQTKNICQIEFVS